jgi:hypothetical protein|tara:strand:- start:62046 stop:62366 length:321 start_codon:yes stop_codon:yes gene_type:complete
MNLKDNFLNLDTWLRLLLVVLFFLARAVLLWVVNLIVVAQFLFVLATGRKAENIDQASIMLASYLIQIVDYQTFASDTAPWPLSDFPNDSRDPEPSSFIKGDDLNG